MKLNRLGFNKVEVDPNDVLHKKEMKEILGGGYCALYDSNDHYYYGSGSCTASDCQATCSSTYNSLGISCDCSN